MAADTFVYWKNKKKPTRKELTVVLEDYMRGLGKVRWDRDRFFVDIPGKVSWPFARILPDTNKAKAMAEDPMERWFEVYVGKDNIDIITRQMDELTNNIATGFAKLCARYWEGELEE